MLQLFVTQNEEATTTTTMASSGGRSSTISGRNSSNDSFYDRDHRRSSLLAHPYGVEVLEKYMQDKTQANMKSYGHGIGQSLADKISKDLSQIIMDSKETVISAKLRESLQDWAKDMDYLLKGEGCEAVLGYLNKEKVKGQPDFVLRVESLSSTDSHAAAQGMIGDDGHAEKKKQEDSQKDRKKVAAIMGVSVDMNGGEKKMLQAFDYATLAKPTNTTMVLFTLHFDRTKNEGEVAKKLKVTEQAFLFVNHDSDEKNKVGFLWRECYEAVEASQIKDTVQHSCEGILRFLSGALHLTDLSKQHKEYELISDNVAIDKDKKYVYKIFDNRFHPTQRKLANWIPQGGQGEDNEKFYPWTGMLNVRT